jgi:hypothetical protein
MNRPRIPTRTTVSVFSHRGLLSSFQFTREPGALAGTELRVKPGHPGSCGVVPAGIDREEHQA